ncbi:MAG: TetR/AcrR family transcriptional regulator [Acidobacteriia bacterium]|nr:TetR/AcrR family transcriptional regulator [Terriglobia bacterium]
MRPAKLAERQVLRKLTDVFRERGYEGASYAQLMAATGLVKASLYHRFPSGKEEIADAILAQTDQKFAEDVLRAAREAGQPRARARRIARRLREFYGSGTRCLPSSLARQRAEDAVAAIEGGLIVSRVMKNRQPFLRALAELPDRLTKTK